VVGMTKTSLVKPLNVFALNVVKNHVITQVLIKQFGLSLQEMETIIM
jgi:hypothetical protein